MGLAGPHDIGTDFIRQLLTESQKVWLSHGKAQEGLIKARAGPVRHHGMGPAGVAATPAGGAARSPQSPVDHTNAQHTTHNG